MWITTALKSIFCLSVFLYSVTLQAQLQQQFQNFQINDPAALAEEYNNLPWEGDLVDMGPLYQQVLAEINGHYEEIGQRQVDIINQNNGGLAVIGGLNNIGISYKKSFVDFNIRVNRIISPDVFDND